MRVLGIETSCDETAVALYDSAQHRVTHQLFSQTLLHEPYGGVIPELASRDHGKKLLPLVMATLSQAECQLSQVDGIAYTAGPGLAGALLVGAAFGRSLAWALNIPVVEVNHLEAHILAVMLEPSFPTYPWLALLVSGGHTLLVKASHEGHYELLGETLDDAAGECFDKTAKLLGLGYPGGPQIAALAAQGSPTRFTFPKPMVGKANLDFSFSGLKTHVRTLWEKLDKTEQDQRDVAYALEDAIVQVLALKCQKALKQTGISSLVLAGGVASNQKLRAALTQVAQESNGNLFYPRSEYCTDNGAMVAFAGFRYLERGKQLQDLNIRVYPRWALTDL